MFQLLLNRILREILILKKLPPKKLAVQARARRKVWGKFRLARAKNRGRPAACSFRAEPSKILFSFLEEFLAWRRAVASGDGAASLVPFKIGSSEVYNYSTKCNLFGIDCSARRVRRAPQGKIRFCFRRKIPEFAPITI